MNCPNCNSSMELTDEDYRQEWRELTYYCEDCKKHFCRRTEYQTQSELVASDKIEEIQI